MNAELFPAACGGFASTGLGRRPTRSQSSRAGEKAAFKRSHLICLAAGLLGLFLGGCATVQPWERAALAEYKMRPDRDPLLGAMSEHIYFSREASSGGRGVGGSGCGCN